ncbi:MAG: helix-turn-helix domain-containing protein [Fibrobacterota bacterium]|nr:MAG: helix-turn-helix domain-containing protein [Fibrobacterota bacterium]
MLTTGQASRLLGVTSQTVINWMESGVLPFVRVGLGRRKVRPEDLQAVIDRNGIPASKLAPELWGMLAGVGRSDEGQMPPYFILESSGRMVHWSNQALERFGWAARDLEGELVSRLEARVPGLPVDLSDLSQPDVGESYRSLLLEIKDRSGQWLPTEVTVSWIHDSRGVVRGSIFMLESPQLAQEVPKRGRPKKPR